jgi:cell division protein ZapA
MKQLEVTIMGQTYILACPEGRETSLLLAVDSVDREMCAIRDAGKVKARERIAVLAALNLAYMLTARPAAPELTATAKSIPSDGDAAHPTTPSAEYVDNLIARLDQALDMDGHLI